MINSVIFSRKQKFGSLGFKVILVTGDTVSSDMNEIGNASLVLTTPEKCTFIVLEKSLISIMCSFSNFKRGFNDSEMER